MHKNSAPGVAGNPCVTVTAKQFYKPSRNSNFVELHTLRKGEAVVIRAVSGQIMELKVLVICAKSATPTELTLKVSP